MIQKANFQQHKHNLFFIFQFYFKGKGEEKNEALLKRGHFMVMPRGKHKEKKVKKKITAVLVGILVIGLVSAGIVPWISNIVTGTVSVEGPIFYAHSGNELEINEYSGGTTYYTVDNVEDEIFWGSELSEELDFYRPSLTFYVLANLTEGIEPKKLRLTFEYIDDNDDVNEICYTEVSVNKGEYQELSGTCEGDNELDDVTEFIYRIEGRGDEGTEYKIKVDGYTRVEMTKA